MQAELFLRGLFTANSHNFIQIYTIDLNECQPNI